jgi:hypothetical protein
LCDSRRGCRNRGDPVGALGSDTSGRRIEKLGIARDHRVGQKDFRFVCMAGAHDIVRQVLGRNGDRFGSGHEPGGLGIGLQRSATGRRRRATFEPDPRTLSDSRSRGDPADQESTLGAHP